MDSLWDCITSKYEGLVFSKITIISLSSDDRCSAAFSNNAQIPSLPNIQELSIKDFVSMPFSEVLMFCQKSLPSVKRICVENISPSAAFPFELTFPASLKCFCISRVPLRSFSYVFPLLASFSLEQLQCLSCGITDADLELLSLTQPSSLSLFNNGITSLEFVLKTFPGTKTIDLSQNPLTNATIMSPNAYMMEKLIVTGPASVGEFWKFITDISSLSRLSILYITFSFPKSAIDSHRIISMLPNLNNYNGTIISDDVRREAEMSYLSHFENETDLTLHPTLLSLRLSIIYVLL